MRRNTNKQSIEKQQSYGYYNYCIFSVKEWKENPELLVIEVDPPRKEEGFYSKHFKIRKTDVFDFIKAILPEFDLRMEKKALDLIEEKGLLKVLNSSLVGRCVVVKDDICDYLEYSNGGMSPKAITCMDIEGKLYAENGGKYFEKFPKFSEMYPDENVSE